MMKLVIISGRSGSGKSSALNVMEDAGFYCIDNLPAGLLPSLIEQAKAKEKYHENNNIAVCIDARNHTADIANLLPILKTLPDYVESRIVYLDANDNELIKRFSETRRKHPLSNQNVSLRQAIEQETELLTPIATIADVQLNTEQMSLHDLRSIIKKRFCAHLETGGMAILFTSFGFKNGLPVDADLVFDVRCLPNPYWKHELREMTGQDEPVQQYLQEHDSVHSMLNDIRGYLENWLPKFSDCNRSYMTIAIGCTGGMHRSVFISERLNEHFKTIMDNVQIFHRDLKGKH